MSFACDGTATKRNSRNLVSDLCAIRFHIERCHVSSLVSAKRKNRDNAIQREYGGSRETKSKLHPVRRATSVSGYSRSAGPADAQARPFVPSTVARRFPVGMAFSGSSRATASLYRSLPTMTRDSREKGEIRCNFGSLVFVEWRSKTESSRGVSRRFSFPTVSYRLSGTFPLVVAFPFDGLVLNIARSTDNRPTDGERLRVTRVFRNTTVVKSGPSWSGVIRIAIPSNCAEISFRT